MADNELQVILKAKDLAEHTLRVRISTLCYDMSQIFEIAGTLADTEKTDLWKNLPKP